MIRRVAIARFVSPLQHLHPLAAGDDEDDDAVYHAEGDDDAVARKEYYQFTIWS